MYHSSFENASIVMPILKNARYCILNQAKKMVQRWYHDWESCKFLSPQSMPSSDLNTPLEQSILLDECRLLYNEQRALDALDETLSGDLSQLSIQRSPEFFFGRQNTASCNTFNPDSSLWTEGGIFSRMGCAMRCRF